MSMMANLAVFLIAFFFLAGAYKLLKEKAVGDADSLSKKAINVGVFLLSASSLLIVTISIWPYFCAPLKDAMSVSSNMTGIEGLISSLVISLFFLVTIWVAIYFLNLVFENKKIKGGILWLGAGLSTFTLLHITRVVSELDGQLFWTVLLAIIGLILIVMFLTIKWWYDTGRNYLAVFFNYLICCVSLYFIMKMFGWDATSHLRGSIYSLTPIIIVNFLLFWIFVGLAIDPAKDYWKSFGYWVTFITMMILLAVCGVLLSLQTTGKLTWYEMQASRKITNIHQRVERMERREAIKTLPNLLKKFDKAEEKGDLEVAKRYAKKIENLKKMQDKIEHAEVTLPRSVDKTLKWVKNLNPFEGEKEKQTRPPRNTQWQRVNVNQSPQKLLRIYEGDKFLYNSPAGFWVIDPQGKNITIIPARNREKFVLLNFITPKKEVK
jgi:hypothetical protein